MFEPFPPNPMNTPFGSQLTRRHFLGASAAVVASRGLTVRDAYAAVVPNHLTARRLMPTQWLPDPPAADRLRACALVAMDAARAAGADFADIRIGVRRHLHVGAYPEMPVVAQFVGYGIRAWRGTTWSFQHGTILTNDAIATAARSAVAGAIRYAGIDAQLAEHRRHVAAIAEPPSWAATVVTGAWHTPVEIDPFQTSFDDIQRGIGALRLGLPNDTWVALRTHVQASGAHWETEMRVFASTAGSLVTQDRTIGGFNLRAATQTPDQRVVYLAQPKFSSSLAGVEIFLRADVPDEAQRLYDTVTRWQELPFRPFGDVGRYPVVFDGRTMANVVGLTAGCALDGDRAFGMESDASGGSFLSPPLAVLQADAPQFSPLLSAHVHRALPSPMAVQWDDDGVVPEPYSVINSGRVVDFHTTRETAPMLDLWYQRQGRPVRSHGMSVAPTPESVPSGSGGHVAVTPSTTVSTLDDLMRGIAHGFLIVNGSVKASPGLTTGAIQYNAFDGIILEIQRGVPVARTAPRLQFVTKTLLGNGLRAMGDVTTLDTSEVVSYKGVPWQGISQWATAPAAFCADVDVIR